jgi:Flp pilus assembly protein TadG
MNTLGCPKMFGFLKDQRGSTLPIFGVAGLGLVIAAGAAMDMSNVNGKHAEIQAALDSAVLAGAKQENNGDIRKTVKDHFAASFPDLGNPTISISRTSDGTIVDASISSAIKNNFMQVVGNATTTISNRSRALAPRKLSAVSFTPLSAGGWWNKTAKLMVKVTGSSTYVEMLRIDYTSPTYSTGIFQVTPNTEVQLGDYEDAYLLFTIDPDSVGFKEGCAECPTVIKSNDPAWSDRFYINGKQMPKNTKIDLFSAIPCGASTHSWEDGGGVVPDIAYNVFGKCDAVNPKSVRLLK